MTRARLPAALAAALLLGACAGAPPAAPPSPGPPAAPPGAAGPRDRGRFADLAARFTDRAARAERAGDPRRALESWRVVAALRPEAGEPRRRLAELEAETRRAAERRHRAGLARLEAGEPDAARREFLLALAADPDHEGALEALRIRLDPDVATHTVAAGESFAGIAERFLGDAGRGVVVARVNGLDPDGAPEAGSRLLVPLLAGMEGAGAGTAVAPEDAAAYREGAAGPVEPKPPPAAGAPAPEPDADRLATAERLLKAGRFREAAAAAEKSATGTGDRRGRELAAAAWFGVGDGALAEERFDEAAAAYRRADPSLRDVPAALAAVERRRTARADEIYNDGVRFFIDEKLDEAIAAWERTLSLNPDHPKAPKDLEKARSLQRRLRELR